ncbi:MAG: hypothetical protein JO282_06995 [Alphaproteobacteria bacterium]|nr:hypothetical protein [Alphaproteobacteria bacterium]
MQIDLADQEAAVLLGVLNRVIEDDRYPLSPRIRMLHDIRTKFPTARAEPRGDDCPCGRCR